MTPTNIVSGPNGISIHFANGLCLRFAIHNGAAIGITDVRAGNLALRNPRYPIRPLIETTHARPYRACRFIGCDHRADEVVIRTALESDDGKPADALDWVLAPRGVTINGIAYTGFSCRYEFAGSVDTVERVIDRATWEPGGANGTVITKRTQGDVPEATIDGRTDVFFNEWGRFINRQCFDYQRNQAGALVIYYDRVALIASGSFCPRGSDVIYHTDDIHIPRLRQFATPDKIVLFSPVANEDQWADIQEYLQEHYLRPLGMHRETPVPVMNVSRPFYYNNPAASFAEVAETLLPKAHELGFKRVYIGPIWWDGDDRRRSGCSTPRLEVTQFGGEAGLKHLCDEAHKLGIEIMAWFSSYIAGDAPLIAEHPDWIVTGESGYSSLNCLDYTSGYREYCLAQQKGLRARTGLDGFWLDSFTHGFGAINPTTRQGQVAEILNVVSELQQCGYFLYTEGYSPFGLFSAEFHLNHLRNERGFEQYAYKTSRYYIGPPNALDDPARIPLDQVDYFRYYANQAPMLLEYDRIREHPDVEATLRELNPRYNQVVALMERRHLLEDDRGVEWRNRDNGDVVLFAYRPFAYAAQSGTRVERITSAGPEQLPPGPFKTEARCIYRIHHTLKTV